MKTVVDLTVPDPERMALKIDGHVFSCTLREAANLAAELALGVAVKVDQATQPTVVARSVISWKRMNTSDYRAIGPDGRMLHVFKDGKGWFAEVDDQVVTSEPLATKKAAQDFVTV